jgi:hypothetical protein
MSDSLIPLESTTPETLVPKPPSTAGPNQNDSLVAEHSENLESKFNDLKKFIPEAKGPPTTTPEELYYSLRASLKSRYPNGILVESHNNEKKVCYLRDASFGESTYEIQSETAHIYVEVNLKTAIARCFECGQLVTSRHVVQSPEEGAPAVKAEYVLILIERCGKSPSGILAEETSTEAILPIALEDLDPVLVDGDAKSLALQKFIPLKIRILMRYPLGHEEKGSPVSSETLNTPSHRYPTRVHRPVHHDIVPTGPSFKRRSPIQGTPAKVSFKSAERKSKNRPVKSTKKAPKSDLLVSSRKKVETPSGGMKRKLEADIPSSPESNKQSHTIQVVQKSGDGDYAFTIHTPHGALPLKHITFSADF